MILSMQGQVWLFLHTVLVGVAAGVFYDAFRVLRKTTPHSVFVVALEDFIFWAVVTLGIFYFMLNQTYGEIRVFSVIGAICGALIYLTTVSQFVVKISVQIVEFLKRVIRTVVRILLLPFKLVGGWLFSLCRQWLAPPAKKFAVKTRKDLHGLARYGKIHMKKAGRSWFILRKKV